jgi:hypothetical protein
MLQLLRLPFWSFFLMNATAFAYCLLAYDMVLEFRTVPSPPPGLSQCEALAKREYSALMAGSSQNETQRQLLSDISTGHGEVGRQWVACEPIWRKAHNEEDAAMFVRIAYWGAAFVMGYVMLGNLVNRGFARLGVRASCVTGGVIYPFWFLWVCLLFF